MFVNLYTADYKKTPMKQVKKGKIQSLHVSLYGNAGGIEGNRYKKLRVNG